MKKILKAGLTDQSLDIFIQDSSSTTGAGLTGLAFNTASLVCYYRRGSTGSATALTLATQTVGGAHSDGGFVAIDGTNMPGMYRLDLSDAIVASGVTTVTLMLKGATNMAPLTIELQLVSVDLDDTVRFGLTALPNVAQGNAGQLPTATAAGLVTLAAVTHTGAVIPTVSTLTGHTAQTGDTYALANGANGFAAIKAQTAAIETDTAEIGVAGAGLTNINLPDQTMNITGNITGNLSGSVGSVTGAVGSVTGNVGGNVAGSVGSVTGNVGGNVAGSVGSVTAEVTPTAASKTGYRLSATGVDDVLDEVVLGSYTMRQLLRGLSASMIGKLSGAATTTVTIRSADDTKDVVVATVDADGNRSAITLDLT